MTQNEPVRDREGVRAWNEGSGWISRERAESSNTRASSQGGDSHHPAHAIGGVGSPDEWNRFWDRRRVPYQLVGVPDTRVQVRAKVERIGRQ